MATAGALNAARRIRSAQLDRSQAAETDVARLLDEELRLPDLVAALRRSDKLLEQQGVSVEQRDFLIKSLAILEGPTSTPVKDAVIGTAP